MYNLLSSFTNTNGAAFPATAAVNSSGGGATDGTEFVKIMVDDIWGFFQALLNYTDDTPAGTSELTASQLLNSIQKITANSTELTTNTTHTVQDFDKYSMLILSSGCTVARLVGGTGANETNKVLVQNNNTVTVEVDFGAAVDQEEIILQPGQWIEFIYDSEATKFIFQRSNMQIIIAAAADYTIGDWVPSGSKILVSPNSSTQKGTITVLLPTMADNIGKWYEVEHKTGQGLIEVDGEGVETLNFKGEQITTCKIYSAGMGYTFKNNGSDWVMKGNNILNINWQNRNDWTDVILGNGVTYDNGSAASTKSTDWTGMVITEATSGFTGVVVEDTGGTGTTGILYVYELSNNFTFWSNDRVLTASNGETIDINEGTGSSKNIDYNLFHEFGINFIFPFIKPIMSTDKTIANTTIIGMQAHIEDSTNDGGIGILGVDTNSIKIQTASEGLRYVEVGGGTPILNTQDYYNNIILDFSC
jgi:hypothetical protein